MARPRINPRMDYHLQRHMAYIEAEGRHIGQCWIIKGRIRVNRAEMREISRIEDMIYFISRSFLREITPRYIIDVQSPSVIHENTSTSHITYTIAFYIEGEFEDIYVKTTPLLMDIDGRIGGS